MSPTQLERAARHYCKLMGKEADEAVNPRHVRWEIIAQELRVHWAMNEALKEGMRDPELDEAVKNLFETMPDSPVDKGSLSRWVG